MKHRTERLRGRPRLHPLHIVGITLGALAGLLLIQCQSARSGETQKVRPPAVAGSFYPADPKALETMIDGFLAKAAPPPLTDVVAIVSPHAGYEYAGQVAAYSYALLKGKKIDRVVVIAPSHYEAFGFASVYDGIAYSTTLGQVPVDREFAARLVKMSPLIKLSDLGHGAGANRPEHALEDQLPFLQRILGQFQLVPIVIGDQSYETCRALGLALAKLIQGTNTLIVASSDLSHYHPYNDAVKIDHKTLKAIEEWDYLSMSRNFAQQIWEACGGYPIIAAMIASERLGASHAKVLNYANSGDTAGDKSRVVGYGAVAFVKNAARGASNEAAFSLTEREKDELLRLARKSVETAVREHKMYEAAPPASEALNQERGAFVTIKKLGQLRGCIGYVAPMRPLYQTVRDVAAYAAVRDTRFNPVTERELSTLEYEVSVLSPLRRVLDVSEIKVGLHGLVMKRGETEGLLLPQVASEEKWDRTTFLEETCYKAGLPKNSWKDADTDIFRFTALVFGERKLTEPDSPMQ
ncbi:MAG TPA: AmmeMemoRadiSam system protein B [Bryobacteraceae bacterium]|nr:AmmeMemoRadiSam system protein B [Bryobacteraceae bacterium]